jgi:DNA invertase Pin-like site-specific DNA recombinase
VAEGLGVLHKCDRPPCCNPEHLFVGTQLENMADCKNKGRHVHGEIVARKKRGTLNPQAKLTIGDVLKMRSQRQIGKSHSRLAEAFGISRAQVSRILSGKKWSHIGDSHASS